MYRIAVVPGDGTGPEVVREGLKVLAAAAEKYDFKYETQEFDWGGDRYLATGNVLPDDAADTLRKFDVIYLGAIGHPDVAPGILEKGILLRLRFELDQYINLRPVKLYPGVDCPLKDKKPEDVDFDVIRENTEGFYAGCGGVLKKGTPDETAIQTGVFTRKGAERCIRYAFERCRARNDTKTLTLPDIKREYAHVDATTMWFVKNPEWFDTIVTPNLFGDIITDLGAMIQGGMGVAAGGNINPEGVSMFEPIGGSAPKYTGKGVINPLAAICALGMLLEIIGEKKAANSIEESVKVVTGTKLKSLSAGKMGYSTSEVGDLVIAALK
ncbi:MAG: isocitrate/isopropylmalate family dehydrogenase [Planctomycetota bacterium]|jgi:3-isopropylmalate dehydrogenase